MGISLYPVDGTDGEALMRAADTGMYHAKEKGRSNFQFFTPALNKAVHQRLVMENSLRQAWAADRLTLHYQPQVDMTSGAIISCEALLRWQRPGGKAPISCGGFIAIAEETGLIVPIGEWALRAKILLQRSGTNREFYRLAGQAERHHGECLLNDFMGKKMEARY